MKPDVTAVAKLMADAKQHARAMTAAFDRIQELRPDDRAATTFSLIGNGLVATLEDPAWWEATLPLWQAAAAESARISRDAMEGPAN